MGSYRFKIVVVGDFGVGKTTLISRFVDEKFKDSYIPTLGVQFTKKNIKFNGDTVDLIIWDIAGQDSYLDVRQRFYGQTEGFFIVYDTTRMTSLNNVKNWYEDVINNTGKIPCVLIGSKMDLVDKRKVTEEDVKKLLDTNKIDIKIWIETSSKTGKHVEDCFNSLVKLILEKRK